MVKPDGGLLRRFRAPAVDDTRQIGFIAEPGGGYRIELSNAATHRQVRDPSRCDPAARSTARALGANRSVIKSHDRGPSKRDRRRHQQYRAILGGRRAQRYSARRAAGCRWEISTRDVSLAGHVLDTQRRRARAELGLTHACRQFDARLADTDVWYLTKRLPAGARFEYSLSPDDLRRLIQGLSDRRATAQADPLNPNDWGCAPQSTEHECLSSAELPGARPQPWRVKLAGKPEGPVEHHVVNSQIKTLDRPFTCYPTGYRRAIALCVAPVV